MRSADRVRKCLLFGVDRRTADITKLMRLTQRRFLFLRLSPEAYSNHRFQNSCDGMRNARLKRVPAFCQAMIIVSSAMVSSS
jgi:hypothetical protein